MSKPIILEIDSEQAARLKSFYENEVSEYSKRIAELQFKLQSSTKMLSTINARISGREEKYIQKPLPHLSNGNGSGLGQYKKDWTWSAKVLYVITKINKAITLNQILDEIRTYEPHIGSGMNPTFRKIQAGISANLKARIDNGSTYNRVKADNGQYLYGFKEWFKDDGTLFEKYV